MVHNLVENDHFDGALVPDPMKVSLTLWAAWWMYVACLCVEAWPYDPIIPELPQLLQHRRDLPTGSTMAKLQEAGHKLPWGEDDYSQIFPISLAAKGLFDVSKPGDEYAHAYETNLLTMGDSEQSILHSFAWAPVLPHHAMKDFFSYSPCGGRGSASSAA